MFVYAAFILSAFFCFSSFCCCCCCVCCFSILHTVRLFFFCYLFILRVHFILFIPVRYYECIRHLIVTLIGKFIDSHQLFSCFIFVFVLMWPEKSATKLIFIHSLQLLLIGNIQTENFHEWILIKKSDN